MSSRHIAVKGWGGLAFLPSPPTVSAAVMLREELQAGSLKGMHRACASPSSRPRLQSVPGIPPGDPLHLNSPQGSGLSPVSLGHPPSCMEGKWALASVVSAQVRGEDELTSMYNEFWNKALHVPAKCYYFKYLAFFFFFFPLHCALELIINQACSCAVL